MYSSHDLQVTNMLQLTNYNNELDKNLNKINIKWEQ